MAGYTIPFALPRQPRTPRYRPRRDFVVTAGDDVTLELTIYQDDMGGGPVDVTGAEATWTIWQDGSTALVEVTGDIEDAPAGRIDVVIAAAATTDIPGRYSHTLRIEFPNGMTTVVTGMIHIQPVYGTGTGGGDPGTMTPAEGIYGDVIIGELTAASAIISGALDVHGLVTLHNDAINSLTVAGGAVFGPSDFRQVEILPTTTVDGPTGMPQAFLVRRVGSDDTVGAAGNLWVSQSSWVLTDTSAPAGVRYNSLVSTASGAGVDPGEVWGFTSILSTQASTDSLNAVPIYGQGVRRGLPTSGVGVPILAGVLEARSLTGASSATDGRLRSLELDIFANGADDITPGPGREALTIVLDKDDAGGAAPHVTSVIGVYTGTGATCSWVLRPNLTWTEAFLDARGGTQGGSAHTIWLKSSQTIALDASAATKIGSDGSTITLTGAATVTGAVTAATMRAEAGAIEATGNYSKTTAPLDVRFSLIRTDPANVSLASRDLTRMEVTSDRHNTRQDATGASSNVVLQAVNWSLGINNTAIADSWDGHRTVQRISMVDRNSPASSLLAPDGTASPVAPELNVTWSGLTLLNTRGGTAPEVGYAVGRNFLDYGSVLQRSPTADGLYSGAQNLTRTHMHEYGMFFFQKTSVQSAGGIGLNVAANRGVSPVYEFTGYTLSKSGVSSLGFRMGFGASGWALHGLDPLRGIMFGARANRADPLPKMLTGLHLSDVVFSGPAIRWPGGDIAGGAHSVAGTGRIRVGTSYWADTATGASIRASGYVGRPSGYVFVRGSTLSATDPKITIRPSMIADDAYGGSYRLYGLDIPNNQFTRAVCLTAPVYDGASPPATLTIALRDTSGGVTEWEVTEAGTTTVHPTQLTTKIEDFYVGRTLTYLNGPAAGESQTITAYDEVTGELTTAAFSVNPTTNVSLVVNFNFSVALSPTANTIATGAGWQWTVNGDMSLVTAGTTSAGNATLNFATTTGVVVGMVITDASGGIPPGSTVVSVTDTTVVSSAVAVGAGVASGATIAFQGVGGTGTVTRNTSPVTHIELIGDGTYAASIDQEITFSGASNGILSIWAYGSYRIKIGSTRGGTDYEDRIITAPPIDPTEEPAYVLSTTPFYSAGTSVWIRIENASVEPCGIRVVRAAEGETLIPAIRAAITTPTWEVTQSWTELNQLDLQDDGGPTVVGGTMDVVSDFSVATNKFTANATTGATVAAGTSTAGSFIPTSATVPSLGMYKPAITDTLAWAVATTSKLYLDGSNLYPVANDGLALGKSGSGFADAFFASGAVLNFDAGDVTVTHGSNVLTFAGGRFLFGSSTDDGSTVLQVNGTAKITGTATLAAFNASAQSTVNLSGTSISSVAGLVLGLAAVDGLGTGQLLDARAANPQISFRRANGTSTAMTALASGDIIGNIQFRGHDGSALTTTRATIEATAAEAWSGSANGTNLLFKTSTIGAATATTRVTITDAGHLVMASGLLCRYAVNTTSAAGTTRADATQLFREFTRLHSVASGTGVILQTGVVGMYVTIYNGGANPVKVYANGSETIDGTAGSTGVTLTNGNACMYVFSATNTWHSFLMGGRSA